MATRLSEHTCFVCPIARCATLGRWFALSAFAYLSALFVLLSRTMSSFLSM